MMVDSKDLFTWLIEQRDDLRASRDRLRSLPQLPEIRDELIYVEGALTAIEHTHGYFGKLWIA